MAALGTPVLINPARSYWLSSIGPDVVHSTIVVDQIDANDANISTLFAENITASTMNVSTLNFQNSDVSGMYVSSIRGNTAFFSTLTMASDLSGGLGFVRFSVDASGIQVDGDPIRFDNLVYLTSTINIIQVSTLVDTDIFASNGYFSSLSSGNFTAGASQISSAVVGDLSGTNGSFDRLFVSSLEALDISGVAPSTWSLYPTLNSSIIFQPGYVLSNINNTLWFAGNELTDASGGGQDWSIFPAFSTVQMANNSIGQLSTLGFQDGGRLASVTGNNLLYNGSNISYGPGGFASNWAQYPANCNVNMASNTLFNVSQINGSNLALNGSNITNGNTFTGSLGVGGLSITPLASITSGGDVFCRNLDVGDSGTGLADVAIYGNFAAPGDNALYVIGGTTLTGGLTAGVPVHGTEIGALPVAGVDTVRIDVLPVGMGLNSATYIQLAAAGAGSFAAGGALSLAGGDYVEINTDDCRIINTTSGNQSTTLTVANIQMPASVAASVPLQINNTAGGGINIVGSSGVGQIAGFSSIAGNAVTAQSSFLTTSLVNFSQVSTFIMGFGLILSTTVGDLRANNFQLAEDMTGAAQTPLSTKARLVNISSIQSGTISTTNLVVSTINGLPWDISGNDPLNNNYSTLNASSFKVSTMSGYGQDTFVGSTIFIEGGIQFTGYASALGPQQAGSRFISSLRQINSIGETLFIDVSECQISYNEGINPNGSVRIGGGGAFDSYFVGSGLSTQQIIAKSTNSQIVTTSTLNGYGGGEIKVGNALSFTSLDAIDNVAVINLNPTAVPSLLIGASTISLDANNTLVASLSSLNLRFSTATAIGSNTAFNYPLILDYDHAGAGTNASGVAMAIKGHNFGTGAVINQIEMGARANGENYIMASWPGSNLEDLYIDATDIIVRDGTLSTIINLDPYGVITSAISTQSMLVSSVNGGVSGSNVTGFPAISTTRQWVSTIQMYDDNLNQGPSSLMNVSFQYNTSTFPFLQGFTLENYVNYVDNLDFSLTGNSDGAIITSYTNNRSSLSELFINALTIGMTVSTGQIVSISEGAGPITEIGGAYVNTSSISISSINGNDPNPAFTNNIMTSTMDLYAASTTLVYWDSTSTSSNINTSNYDAVVGVNGTYKIGVSLQFNNTSGTDLVEFFFLKNDSVISQAGGIINVQNNVESLEYCEIIEPLVNGDKIQVGCYTNASDVKLSTINGDVLQSPAAILTMYKIS